MFSFFLSKADLSLVRIVLDAGSHTSKVIKVDVCVGVCVLRGELYRENRILFLQVIV